MKKTAAIIGAFALPMIALAQNVQGILATVGTIINMATVIVVALALLAFLYGLMKYLFSGPGENKDSGRDIMIWGVIALFVMVAVWGLVRVLANTFNVGTGGSAPIPGVLQTGFFGNTNSGSWWGTNW